jgi:aspartyl protease family protein
MLARMGECKALLLALLLSAAPACADEPEVEIVGLSNGRAVIVIGAGGRPKVYRDGDVLPNGARLIRATSQSALIEIDGKRRTMTMGSRVSAASPVGGASRVTLVADSAGHFITHGSINGAPVRLLVDTGATLISMGVGDARRIGLEYHKGQRGFSNTANGVAPVYKVRLDSVKVGDITINGVDALVHESDMPWVLLGMSFLNRVEMRRAGDNLDLVKRY